jgi:tetratricopeptide (TPR) repeat protein
MEAMSSFDEAEKLIPDPMDRGLAMIQQAELFARAANPECAELCKRIIAAESPASPLALLVAGVHELKARPSAALDSLKNGLSQVRRPRMIDDASFDFPWVYSSIRAAADRETGEDRLVRLAGILGEIGRLQPLSTRVALDHAAILLRARRFEEAADRFLATGAVLQAADACAEGGLYLRAASLYRQHVDLQPGSNADGLFRRAMSLKKAGDSAGAMAGFEEYLARAGASGSSAGMALLEKAALQEPEDALATYDRVLKAREVTTSPARDDWALALLGRGRTLLRLSRAPEARKDLLEYLERYAEGPSPAPASIEAAWLLVGAAIGERQWKAGLARLRELELLASRIPDPDRAPYADLLKEARFVEGDLHFNLEDYAASYRAYGEAVRRHADSEDRLWGLIGRARALARLERKEEARRDYSNARAIFEGGPFTGHGRDYWEIALDSLERELR